jgi:hypothetical protein
MPLQGRKCSRPGASPLEKLLLHSVDAPDGSGCRLWCGATTEHGVGVLDINRSRQRAHKVALELKLGRSVLNDCEPIQTCGNRRCISGDHLIERKRVVAGDPVAIAEKLARYSRPTNDGSGCRVWTKDTPGFGYGQFQLGNRRAVGAHRVALELKLGRPIAEGMEALHSCDNPACVNADHLREGTISDNMRDKAERDRAIFGIQHHNAKLTPEKVVAIRGDHRSISAIARSYGVQRYTIRLAKQGMTWARVA